MKRIICLMLMLAALSAAAGAANQVGITPRGSFINDTIRAAIPGRFEISIANDAQLEAIDLPFILTGSAEYSLDDVIGFQTTPSQPKFVKGITGTRWMSGEAGDGSCWDLGGTFVTYTPGDFPGQFLIEGSASSSGLAPGPLQPMLEVHYTVLPWLEHNEVRQLCIDTLLFPPSAEFIFSPGGTPEALWGDTPLCFPVTSGEFDPCPGWTCPNPIAVTVGRCDTGQVRVSAAYPDGDPVYYYLVSVTGGAGTATVGRSSGDVSYRPDPADVGHTVTIEVDASDAFHSTCLSNPCFVQFTVVNDAPAISCGNTHNIAGSGELFKKFDITATDPDTCDDIQYGIESVSPMPAGTYSIDPVTGVVSFSPAVPEDSETDFEFCVEAFDGIVARSSCFHVYVCTCENPGGDIDGNGTINIGDAVALIAFIFKGSVGPVNMNWADANVDCTVNVADAVYLINYIFKGGPAPQAGCYYQSTG